MIAMCLHVRFTCVLELDEFKRALQQHYSNASWTRYLRLHSASIKTTASTTVTLHYWHGTTSLWLSGDGASLWYNSDDFTQLRQQARDALHSDTGRPTGSEVSNTWRMFEWLCNG